MVGWLVRMIDVVYQTKRNKYTKGSCEVQGMGVDGTVYEEERCYLFRLSIRCGKEACVYESLDL